MSAMYAMSVMHDMYVCMYVRMYCMYACMYVTAWKIQAIASMPACAWVCVCMWLQCVVYKMFAIPMCEMRTYIDIYTYAYVPSTTHSTLKASKYAQVMFTYLVPVNSSNNSDSPKP